MRYHGVLAHMMPFYCHLRLWYEIEAGIRRRHRLSLGLILRHGAIVFSYDDNDET